MPPRTRREKAASLRRRIAHFLPTPYLTPAELAALPSPLLLDTRTRPEHLAGSLPSAHPPRDAARLLAAAPRDRPVVCFCTVGLRSGLYAARHLRGRENVYNYSVMEHLWGGGKLVRPEGGGEGVLHVFSTRYEGVMPEEVGEVVAYGSVEAVVRAMWYVPAMMRAAVEYARRKLLGKWMGREREIGDIGSEGESK